MFLDYDILEFVHIILICKSLNIKPLKNARFVSASLPIKLTKHVYLFKLTYLILISVVSNFLQQRKRFSIQLKIVLCFNNIKYLYTCFRYAIWTKENTKKIENIYFILYLLCLVSTVNNKIL